MGEKSATVELAKGTNAGTKLDRLLRRRAELDEQLKGAAQEARAAEKQREKRRTGRLGELLRAMMASDEALCLKAEALARSFFTRQLDIDDFELHAAVTWFGQARAASSDAGHANAVAVEARVALNAPSVACPAAQPGPRVNVPTATAAAQGVSSTPPPPSLSAPAPRAAALPSEAKPVPVTNASPQAAGASAAAGASSAKQQRPAEDGSAARTA